MILCFCLCIASGYYFFRIMTSWLILTSFCDFLDFLGPWAQGPWAHGPWAHEPWAHGPWAHGPWAHGPWAHGPCAHRPQAHGPRAHGPGALWRRAERRQFSKSSHPPSQPAPRGRDKPVVETPHWDETHGPISSASIGPELMGPGQRVHRPMAACAHSGRIAGFKVPRLVLIAKSNF